MDVPQAIRDIEFFRNSHVRWAECFEADPSLEAAKVATGEWDDAKEHRRIVAAYDNVLAILRGHKLTDPVPAG